jgi:hypothetical protein
MTVDDYSSGLNVRRHQNKLGTAISDSGTGGPRRRQQIGSEARRAGSFLVDLRARMFLATWRIRFTSQLTSCCSRMTLLQWLTKRINPVIP